jgi:hypothetical protein
MATENVAAEQEQPKSKFTSNKRIPIEEFLARMGDDDGEDASPEGEGKIVKILRLHRAGYTRSEIVKAGFNRSTVYRQVGDFERWRTAPQTHYMGFELYEARITRIMKRKNMTRDEAANYIAEQDIEKD